MDFNFSVIYFLGEKARVVNPVRRESQCRSEERGVSQRSPRLDIPLDSTHICRFFCTSFFGFHAFLFFYSFHSTWHDAAVNDVDQFRRQCTPRHRVSSNSIRFQEELGGTMGSARARRRCRPMSGYRPVDWHFLDFPR